MDNNYLDETKKLNQQAASKKNKYTVEAGSSYDLDAVKKANARSRQSASGNSSAASNNSGASSNTSNYNPSSNQNM